MAKLLLSCLAASLAASAFAAPRSLTPVSALEKGIAEKSISISKPGRSVQSRIAAGNVNVLQAGEGRSMKQLRRTPVSNSLRPLMQKAPATKGAGQTVLFEDFEGWDGVDYGWLPEGFSYIHNSGREDAEQWSIASPEIMAMIGMGGVTGNCLSINYDFEFLDEWIVFPEVTLGNSMVLTFDVYNDPVWYFSMDNVNWDTFQYEGEKILAFDQQVMVSEDGGQTWTLLKSLAEDFMDIDDFEELLAMGINGLRPVSVSLAAYSGKTVRLAFRYIGTDGNTSAIDNISIGNPPLQVSYSNPWGALYFGMTPDGISLTTSVLTGPVFRSMVFENTTYNYDATYSWDYFGPESTWQTADTQDYLEVTYHTVYSDSETPDNLYYMPVLHGSAEGYVDGNFSREGLLQAGGKATPLVMGESGTIEQLHLGLSVVDPATEGAQTVTDFGMPYFGYDPNVDRFWTEYTFGDEWDDQNYVRLESFIDYFPAPESPIVISGVHSVAYGRVKDGVRFKAELVPLSDEGEILDTPLAVAYCGYSDLTVTDYGSTNMFLSLNFKFDEPFVMSSEVTPAYLVRISGFNDPEHVEYFSPLLTEKSNTEMAYGWISKAITFEGETRRSTTPVAQYVDELLAFYIMLDAEFPWLVGPSVVDSWEGVTAIVTLDSSVAGKDLSFEGLPDWLTATAEGIYGKTVVTFTAAMTDDIKTDAEVTVSAPGVSHTLTVKAPETTGVSAIGSASGSSEIYNLSGLRVSSMDAPGIYILKTADGQTRKVTK